jgi:hypothetical protein
VNKNVADPVLTIRLGPATNLRPAGAHKNAKRATRSSVKQQLRKESE